MHDRIRLSGTRKGEPVEGKQTRAARLARSESTRDDQIPVLFDYGDKGLVRAYSMMSNASSLCTAAARGADDGSVRHVSDTRFLLRRGIACPDLGHNAFSSSK